MYKIVEKDSIIRVRYQSFLLGFCMVAAGLFLMSLPFLDQSGSKILIAVFLFGLLIFILGFLAFFKRTELELNMASRSFRFRWGNWPRVQTLDGSFDDLEGPVLETETSDRNVNFVVKIGIRGRVDSSVELYRGGNEESAYESLQAWGQRLNLAPIDDLIDRNQNILATSPKPPTSELQRLSRTPSPTPPPGSHIHIEQQQGEILIFTNEPRSLPIYLMVMVVGLFFLSFTVIVGRETLYGSGTDSLAQFIMGAVMTTFFFAIGGSLAWFSFLTSFGKDLIVITIDSIQFGTLLGGRRFLLSTFYWHEIQEIDIVRAMESPSSGLESQFKLGEDEIRVRSSKKIHRFGKKLNQEERTWLKAFLLSNKPP